MSHLRTCSVKLSNINIDIARQALLSIAENLELRNPEIVNEVYDFYGKHQKVLIGLRAEGFRGYGVIIENNNVKIVGDEYKMPVSLKQFSKLFVNYYTATAVQHSLKRLGFNTTTQTVKEKVYVMGVKI